MFQNIIIKLPMNKEKIFRIGSNLIVRLSASFLGVATQFILGFLITPKEYGKYIVIVTICNLMLIFSKWGLDSLTIKEIARFECIDKDNEKKNKSSFFYFSIVFVMLSSFIFIMLLYCSKEIKIFNFHWFTGANVALFIIFSPFLGLSSIALSLLRGLSRTLIADFIENLARPLVFIITCYSAYYFWHVNSESLSISFIISYFIIFIICWMLGYKEVKLENISMNNILENKNIWLNQAMFINGTALIGFAYFQLDTILVAKLLGQEKAGIYGMICNFTRFVTMLATILSLHYQPQFVKLLTGKKNTELISLLKKSLVIAYVFGLLAFIGLAIVGKFVLTLINPGYAVGYVPMLFISFAHTFNCVSILLIAFGNMVGLHKRVMFFYLFGGIVTTLMNIVLLPRIDLIGGGISLSVGLILLNSLLTISILKKLKL